MESVLSMESRITKPIYLYFTCIVLDHAQSKYLYAIGLGFT